MSPKSRYAILFFLIACVVLAIPFHVNPQNFIVDDGFFYPQIARYIAHGQGSTFNGWMPTNGYHPLWMLVCVVAAKITSQPTPLLQILGLVDDLLITFSVLALFYFARAAQKRGIIAGAGTILFMAMVLGIWRLLETDLALAVQFALLAVAVPIFPRLHTALGRHRSIVLGLLLGIMMLTRLDLVFFAFLVLLAEVFRRDNKQEVSTQIGAAVVPGAVASALVLPYLIWNVHNFGHLLPVSGAIKSSFPHLQQIHLTAIVVIIPIGILLSVPLLFRKQIGPYEKIALMTAAGALVHYVYTVCFGGMSAWYPTTGFICLAMGLIYWSDWLLCKLSIPYWLEMTAATLLIVAMVGIASIRAVSNLSITHFEQGTFSLHASYIEPGVALGLKLKQTLPANSRIFIYDSPGSVAFYSNMSLLPADGLVTNFSYNKELAREGFARYAAQNQITYVVAPYVQPEQIYDRMYLREQRVADGQTMQVAVPLGGADAGTVFLEDKNLIFLTTTPTLDIEKTYPQVGLWRIDTQ